MKFDKRIVTHKWGNNPTNNEYTNSNGVILSANTYQHSMSFLQVLAAEAKKDFPDLTDKDIEVITVTFSGYNQGFWGIRFPLPDNTKHNLYRDVNQLDFRYLG